MTDPTPDPDISRILIYWQGRATKAEGQLDEALTALAEATEAAYYEGVRLEQVGWGGPTWGCCDLTGERDHKKPPQPASGWEVMWSDADEEWVTYHKGDWYLRHEDGADELIEPWPVYRLAAQEVTDD